MPEQHAQEGMAPYRPEELEQANVPEADQWIWRPTAYIDIEQAEREFVNRYHPPLLVVAPPEGRERPMVRPGDGYGFMYIADGGGVRPKRRLPKDGEWSLIHDIMNTCAQEGDVVCQDGVNPQWVMNDGCISAGLFSQGAVKGYIIKLYGNAPSKLAHHTIVYTDVALQRPKVGCVWRRHHASPIRMSPLHSRPHPFFTR